MLGPLFASSSSFPLLSAKSLLPSSLPNKTSSRASVLLYWSNQLAGPTLSYSDNHSQKTFHVYVQYILYKNRMLLRATIRLQLNAYVNHLWKGLLVPF